MGRHKNLIKIYSSRKGELEGLWIVLDSTLPIQHNSICVLEAPDM